MWDFVPRLGFHVDRDRIGSGLEEARKVMVRPFDHEMDVERKLSVLADRRDNGGPEGNVIDEMAIHDVEMEPIGARFFDAMDLGFEMGEIRGENGRGHQNLGIEHTRFQFQCSGFSVQRNWLSGNLNPET